MDVVEALTQNLATTSFKDLPTETVEVTKKSILDTIGVMLAASTLGEGCREMVEIALDGAGKEESTVIAFGGKLPCWMAAFCNGALAHPLDYDDTADAARVHPTASTLPAALALAEREGKSGKDLITAVALGNDLVTRLGLCLPKGMSHYGWLFPQVLGAFGSAAAAGKILGLNNEQMRSALGHALNQAAGSLEVSQDTGSVSRGIRDAFTGKLGVLSALMAQRGLAGVHNVFQGKAGLFNIYFRGEYNPDPLTAELGKTFEGANMSFKPWPSCRGTHASIDATLQLVREYNIKSEQVERVTVAVSEGDETLWEKKRKPPLIIDAKISLPFTVALAVTKKKISLSDFTSEGIKDSAVLQMTQKVFWKQVPGLDADGIGPGEVTIALKDGRIVSKRVDFAYGHPRVPVSQDDLIAKFKDCAAYSANPLTPKALEEVIHKVTRLEEVFQVGQITKLLTPSGRVQAVNVR